MPSISDAELIVALMQQIAVFYTIGTVVLYQYITQRGEIYDSYSHFSIQ
jgi:hypothetical protein